MEKEYIKKRIGEICALVPGNILSGIEDLPKELEGLRMYDLPIVGFGSAADPLFKEYQKPPAGYYWNKLPTDFLPEGRSVISCFFPTSQEIRDMQRQETDHPCKAWTFARVEGQAYINACMDAIAEWLCTEGTKTVYPQHHPDYFWMMNGKILDGKLAGTTPEHATETSHASNWSERHAAFVCGLGTFSLSRNLITVKGVAGRFGSVVTELLLEPDERPYKAYDEYCTYCGACAQRCVFGAIDIKLGKDLNACRNALASLRPYVLPRKGCGLCQVEVPCEFAIPKR